MKKATGFLKIVTHRILNIMYSCGIRHANDFNIEIWQQVIPNYATRYYFFFLFNIQSLKYGHTQEFVI